MEKIMREVDLAHRSPANLSQRERGTEARAEVVLAERGFNAHSPGTNPLFWAQTV
jgi:hypothetical protein